MLTFSEGVDRLRALLENCDVVLIGAGAGLSASAGLTCSGPRFEERFSDFAAKYGIRDMSCVRPDYGVRPFY